MIPERKCLLDMNPCEIAELVACCGAPSYRAGQIEHWIYKQFVRSFDEMNNIPSGLKEQLSRLCCIADISPLHELVSRDGTVKTLFTLSDGKTVESALMYYPPGPGEERNTVCVSTQVGCAVGCAFCSTGQQGFERNLSAGEIIGQVLYFARYLKERHSGPANQHITNIVYMGMGEPLSNYENLRRAIDALNSQRGFGLGIRNMTISTAGMVPQILRLGEERLQAGLAVSLHAADNSLRDKLVPLNKKYPLQELIPACRRHYELTGRRTSFEYTLFEGINDSPAQARSLGRLLSGMNCHVNLISANPTSDSLFKPPAQSEVLSFQQELKKLHINVTIRSPKGQDIDAGCGQLRSRFL